MTIQRSVVFTFLGMLVLWSGRFVAGIVFFVGLFRLVFRSIEAGLPTLGLAVVIGLVSRLLGGGMLAMGAAGMRSAMENMRQQAGPAPSAQAGPTGNVYEGEADDITGRSDKKLPSSSGDRHGE